MFIDPTNFSFLIIREWLNGSLFPLSFMLASILLIFLLDLMLKYGRDFRTMEGVPTAIVLFWLFAADSWRAGFVWLTLRMINDGQDIPDWLQWATNMGFIFTALILIATMLRATYLFTPPRWGHAYWLLSVSVTLAFLLVSHNAPPFNLALIGALFNH